MSANDFEHKPRARHEEEIENGALEVTKRRQAIVNGAIKNLKAQVDNYSPINEEPRISTADTNNDEQSQLEREAREARARILLATQDNGPQSVVDFDKAA